MFKLFKSKKDAKALCLGRINTYICTLNFKSVQLYWFVFLGINVFFGSVFKIFDMGKGLYELKDFILILYFVIVCIYVSHVRF